MCQFTQNEAVGGMAGLPGRQVSDEDIVITGLPEPEPLTAWQRVWRDGICPQLTVLGLLALKAALQKNDPRLITGATTSPPPLQCVLDWSVEGCCPLCFALLNGEPPGALSVQEVEERFAEACYQADEWLGEPGAVARFLNAVDEWSREELMRNLLPEVNQELTRREDTHA